jgi:hypothetical protein
MSTAPNPFEYQIIVILCEVEFFGSNIEDYRKIVNLSDVEIVKQAFDAYLNRNWECGLCDLSTRIDYLAGIPAELIPDELFRAAMQVAVDGINWDAVASDVDVVERIRFLKSF